MIRTCVLACLLWLPHVGVAQTSASALDAVELLDEASARLASAEGARDRVAALTVTVRAYEEGLIAMRAGLRDAAIARRNFQNRLDAKETDVARLLSVLQTLGRSGAPALLLHPNGPTDLARSAMIATEVTPTLQAEVAALKAELEELAILQQLQDTAADTLDRGLKGAQQARAELSEAISQRTDLPKRFEDDPVQMRLLINSAETLSAFASGLTEAFAVENNQIYSTDVKGALSLPLQGQIVRGFNEPNSAGLIRPGIEIAARPKSLITSPTPATVLFVGPLLDYGNVVILEPAPNILFVLAGLSDIYAETGQVIPEAFPIGLLGGQSPVVDEILSETDQGNRGTSTQTLYLEVREGQSPVDPITWFAVN